MLLDFEKSRVSSNAELLQGLSGRYHVAFFSVATPTSLFFPEVDDTVNKALRFYACPDWLRRHPRESGEGVGVMV